MRIDSHHHIWDLRVTKQDWIDAQSMSAINRNFLMGDLREAIKGSGIDKTILVQTVTNYLETPILLELAAQDDLIAGVVGWLDISSPDCLNYLDQYQDSKGGNYLRSIREIAQDHTDPNILARPQSIKTVQELGRRGISFDLLTKIAELPGAIEMVKQSPETHFILDHISKPLIEAGVFKPWQELIIELAKFDNVDCKISGMVTEANWKNWKPADIKPYFEIIAEAFGCERLMFGSDWPVATLAASYSDVVNLAEFLTKDLTDSEQILFWGKTAVRAYGLTL